MPSPVLELRDATVVKNDRRILDSLTLTIGVGEHTAIIGPNGAGIQRYGSLGVPVALTAIAFIIGLLVLPAAKETRGEPLPA